MPQDFQVSWQFAFVPMTFQILSLKELWTWRIVPKSAVTSKMAWHSANVLSKEPLECEVASGEQDLHGRDFHLLETHGSIVTINVELWKVGESLKAHIWCEPSKGLSTMAADTRPASKEQVLGALQCRGLGLEEAEENWQRVMMARCPQWWQDWAMQDLRFRKKALNMGEELQLRKPEAAIKQKVSERKDSMSKEETLDFLGQLTSSLQSHQALLNTCRRESTVPLSLAEDFQFMPPRAIQVIGEAVRKVMGTQNIHNLWSACSRHWREPQIREGLALLRKALEGQPRKATQGGQLAVRQQGQLVAACGTKLEVGMRVMLRWQPKSVGATHLAYLNGHVA